MNSKPRGSYSIRRRVALLVGVGALAPTLLALWTLHTAFGEVSQHLLEEHQRLARILAQHFDSELRDTMASMAAATSSGTPISAACIRLPYAAP